LTYFGHCPSRRAISGCAIEEPSLGPKEHRFAGEPMSLAQEALPLIPPVRSRSERVIFAVGLVIGLAVLDLILTHWQMSTVGMFEANPLAVWLVERWGNANVLIPFKLGTLAFGAGILLMFRRRGAGELGAWVAAAAHVYMAVTWVLYLDLMARLPGPV
jgi:hypothetical protein